MTWGEFLAAHAWQLASLVVLLLCSGFFSGTETAVFSLSRGQLHHLRHGHGAGPLVARLMARPRRVLYTLLFGNMLVNVAFASISAALILDFQGRGAPAWTAPVASFAALLALILVGEVTPKMLAYATNERWALIAVGPFLLLQRAFSPVLWVLETAFVGPLVRMIAPHERHRPAVSADEMAAVLDLSAKRGIIDHDASSLLREIVSLADLRVGDIMVPRVDVVAYDVDAPREGLLDLIRRTHVRRIPVYEQDLDHVIGVIHAKRLLLSPAAPLRSLVVSVPFVPEHANVERLLHQLRLRRSQIAVVVDEYGGTAGVVLLRDALEEIVGELPGPGEDRGPAVEELPDGKYLIDADLAIHEWVDAFKIDLKGERISTVGGFVTSLLGRIAKEGDAVTYRNLRFTVATMRGRRIGKLRLELLEESR
jgi:CBS domain containing-hemolysin-like protein